MLGHLILALYLYQDCVAAQSQYAAIPRWGQAVALVESTLYVHGGRTDPYNSFSYTSAPVNNDLLALPLTSSFNPSSPPFTYVGGCSNCSSNQGPAVAWHTLTPLNTSNLLLFGGDPGPNSQVVLPDRADSSVLLSVSDHDSPIWNFETDSWASEPMRRIHHTAVSVGGKVWIVGGEKADGSGTAFAQHYVFDPSGPSFMQLPTTDGPGDITGHQAVPLADGRILVFGGYSPSEKSLIPLSTVWVLDTTKPSWSRLSVSTPSVPPPRRAFAAAVLDSNRVLIHGGADAVLQTTLDDGWVLDTSQPPATWTNVSALTQLGPRRDHFAIGLGTMAIFGFGYAQNGAASASLVVFDAASGTFQTTYTPPSVITAPTATTLPGPTQTGQGSTGTGQPGSAEYPRPTGSQTPGGGDPGGSGNGNGNGGGGGNGNGDGEPSVSGNSSKSHATAIALGTVFGVLGLLVATTAASWYLRRRNSRDSFHRLHPSHDEDSPYSDGPIPVAGMVGSHEKGLPLPPVVRTVKDRLSRVVPGITPSRTQQQRRDMLADEDAREFETAGWYHVERHPSSAQSSWTSKGRPTLEKVYDSLASLKSMGGAMLDYAAGAAAAAAGGRGIRSREGSSSSRADVIWNNEKQRSFDPYEDDFGLLHYSSPPLQADRPRGGRQASSYTYVDPFDDYDIESLKFDPNQEYHDDEDEAKGFLSLRDPPPRTKLQSMMPPATLDLTRLTPVSERTSVPTLSDPASSSETSLSHPSVPFVASSSSSHDPPQSPRRPSSILDTNTPPSQPIQRSNSWWVRFTKTPLLDRRSSNASRTSRPLDFRDPNPPPRLIPIEESVHSNSPDSPESKRRSGSGGHTQRFSTHHHGRSASSLGTAKTADSDILERMARTMTIVQKEGSTTSSQRSAPSRDVSGDTNTHDDFGAAPPPVRPHSARPLSMIESSRSNVGQGGPALVMSPTEMSQEEAGQSISALVSPPPTRPNLPERVSSGSKVAERIQAYERRMSMEQGPPPPSKSPTKSKSPPPVPPRTRTSAYGLAPKAPLFVANPDHRHQSSGDS